MIRAFVLLVASMMSGQAFAELENISYQATGAASWYGDRFHGRKTASGERFNKHAFTAAHKTLTLHSFARVTNLANNESIVVKINDRGPHRRGRIIDLSQGAAKALGIHGVARVEVTAID